MKLKRLLLRYDPAGIGLECADDAGEISVIHKDLPLAKGKCDDPLARPQISREEIGELADTLISGEPTLLSKKKHHQALCQLLGRLYQLEENDPSNAVEKSPKKKKKDKDKDKDHERDKESTKSSITTESKGGLTVGGKALLTNLKAPNAIHSNQVATIVNLLDNGKVEVILEGDSAEQIKVKVSNLIRVQDIPHGSANAGDIPVGTKVSIARLRNHGALNGTVGRVVEFNETTLRYEVRALDTGQLFRVKPDNVLPLMDQDGTEFSLNTTAPPILPPASKLPGKIDRSADEKTLSSSNQFGATNQQITMGCIVALYGLKNAAWLNGEEAEVLGVDEEKGRMDIRLNHDGSVKKVKSDNVKLVRGPENSSAAPDFTPGQIVKLCGLRSAAALNGEKAEIRRKDPSSDRYEIRLELDGSTKKVRKENLQPT